MTVTVSSCDRRILALCVLFGHDRGPDACRAESCDSATIVGLHEAARLASEAWEQLVCGCPSPGECCCDVERGRLKFRHAMAWSRDQWRERAGVWWRQAEQILTGDTDPAYCPMHVLAPLPCGLCGEEDEVSA